MQTKNVILGEIKILQFLIKKGLKENELNSLAILYWQFLLDNIIIKRIRIDQTKRLVIYLFYLIIYLKSTMARRLLITIT